MESKLTSEKFIVFGKPDIGNEECLAMYDVIQTGWIGYGSLSRQFEKKFAEFLGVNHCVAVSSCTIGLILALKAAGIRRGDKVLVPSLTFCATLNAVLEVGANPVLYDYQGDVSHVKDAKAIVPVHLWGEKAVFHGIDDERVKVIEDCAHAFGGSFYGYSLGTFGDFSVFSFYPTKNITTGDGGMVVCKNKESEDLVRVLASQGLSKGAWNRYSDAPAEDYQVVHPGYKGLMNDLAASIGLVQMRRWPEIREKRNTLFKIYEDAFGKKQVGHSQHIYEIRVKNRSKLRRKLYSEGIGTGVHYNPLHLEPAYKFLGYKKGDFPKSEKIGSETLSLPLSSTMSVFDALKVVESVKKYGEISDGI